jgi:hypothetical protein
VSGFQTVAGFEDLWRPPIGPNRRSPETVLRPGAVDSQVRARLARLVARSPEVMVKVTGRTKDPGHLLAHLTYITRNGELAAEDRDGAALRGPRDVRELAEDWSALALADRRRRANTPFSVSIILSMPAGTDAAVVRDAARGFAQAAFADRFDYVFALHTDTPRPHVHLSVCARGDTGERLNPRKADLEAWRRGRGRRPCCADRPALEAFFWRRPGCCRPRPRRRTSRWGPGSKGSCAACRRRTPSVWPWPANSARPAPGSRPSVATRARVGHGRATRAAG